MSKKAVNWLFLVYLFLEAGIVALTIFTKVQFSVVFSLILNQLVFLIPTLIFLGATKTKISEMIPHKRLHPVTPLLCVIYTGLSMPLIMVVNMISLFFVENEATQLAASMLDLPGWIMILIIGILAPMNEEFLFRGTFYGSYRKTGRIVAAMFMSAFLFGLLHQNFNQLGYAIVVGILTVLLIEATGSIASSMIFHITVNTGNVILMLLQRDVISAGGGNTQAMLEQVAPGMSYRQILFMAIMAYGYIAMISSVLAGLLVYGISCIEKRNVTFLNMFKKQKKSESGEKESLWSVPLVVSVVLSFAYMLAELLLPLFQHADKIR